MSTYTESKFKKKPVKEIVAAVAIAACSTGGAEYRHVETPQAPLIIKSNDLPQLISKGYQNPIKAKTDKAVILYHDLRKKLNVSHTVFGKWLGLKRRSLYNWIDNPDSSSKSEEIEGRLLNLSRLVEEMEPEHIELTYKIAFSPLYGDKKFGESILNGSSDEVLLKWYDQLFDKFEAYRNTIKSN